MLSVLFLGVIMLDAVNAECHNADFSSDECNYAKCSLC
jgi:hypothetical protein